MYFIIKLVVIEALIKYFESKITLARVWKPYSPHTRAEVILL